MRPFTGIPLCLALFTFILSGCIQNRCSLPEFEGEGVCQDKPSDMTSKPQGDIEYRYTISGTEAKIHAIVMVDKPDAGPFIAFNLVDDSQFRIITITDASQQTEPQSTTHDRANDKTTTNIIQIEGIAASSSCISYAHRAQTAGKINRIIENKQVSTKQCNFVTGNMTNTSENRYDWSLGFGNNGNLFSLIEQDPYKNINLIVSNNIIFTGGNLIGSPNPSFQSIGRVVVGTIRLKLGTGSNGDAIIWDDTGWNPQLLRVQTSPMLEKAFLPTIAGCPNAAGGLCPVILADVINGQLDEIIIARPNEIHIYANPNDDCVQSCKTDTIIKTKEQAQAVSVSINDIKANRKIVWASSTFDSAKKEHTVTINAIQVSLLM